MNRKIWIVLVVLGLLGIFVFQNTRVVEVRFLFWKLEMSRALMLLGVLVTGLLAGWMLGTQRRDE
jgi:uncharacterized integral membrane protein